MSKLSDYGVIFCITMGGLVLALLKKTSLATLILLFGISVLLITFYHFILTKYNLFYRITGKVTKSLLCVYSILSSAVACATASAVVAHTGAVKNEFYPVIVVLICLFALVFTCSGVKAAKNTTAISTVSVTILMILLLFLCINKRNFSYVYSGEINLLFLLPLTAFSVCDIILVISYISNKNSRFFVLGNITPLIYLIAMVLIAVSTLGNNLFSEIELPLLHLWKSTFIPSFLNNFELIALSGFFICCALKAGFVLKYSTDIFGKDRIWIVAVLLFALVTLISYVNESVYVIAVFSVFCGVVLPIICLIKNY